MEKMENIVPLKNSRKDWVKKIIGLKNKPSNLFIFVIIILASFMRLYKISEYMTFLGDEGRDALVAKEILEGNLTLLGPRASAGDFFLGPIYYYMIAPFLALFNYDPVGPAVMVALIGVATVFLVYYFTQEFFGTTAGLVASFLYAISPVVIAFSRSSWNPNPVPFFSLLLMFSLYHSVKRNSIKLSIVTGILLGVLLQLHYIATFIGVIIFLFVLIGNLFVSRKNIIKKYILQLSSISLGFVISFSPFLLFELKHGFPNIKTIIGFVFIDNFEVEKVTNLSHMQIVSDVLFRLFARLTINFPPPEQLSKFSEANIQIMQAFVVLLIIGSIISLASRKNRLVVALLSIWLLVGVFLFGFYKKDIYDYYYAFIFPVPFLLIGGMVASFLDIKGKYKYLGKTLGLIVFVILSTVLILSNPFQYQGNNQKKEAENIADKVIEIAGGKPYNFALITSGNSDHVYRYFLEVKNKEPVVIENLQIDPDRRSVTDQLIVICDTDCKPVGHSLWEVAGFGRAEIAGEWKVPFVTIYKLVRYDGND